MGAQGADPFGESPKSIGLEQLLREVRNKFSDDEQRIYIEADCNEMPDCVIPVRAAVEALSALVKNALDASPNGVAIRLSAMRPAPRSVRFLVRDEGVGMTSEIMERVAEPFFTTKAPGKGMGLGAFLAHLFAQTLGGTLSFESEPGHGCTAILELPDMKS
jgi:signal transduction histidine kinase